MTPNRSMSPPSGQWAAILSASMVQSVAETEAPLDASVAIGVDDLAARASVCVDRHGAVSAAWRPRTSGPHRASDVVAPKPEPGFDFVR